MKLKLVRSIILSLLAIWSLSSCSNSNTPPSIATASNLQTTNRSESPNLERFRFMRNDKFGYIDRNGNIVIPAQFERAEEFSEGLATVKIGEKYGCIDKTSKLVIPARFDYIYEFKNGVAEVEIDGNKKAKIDKTGKVLTMPTLSVTDSTTNYETDRIESDGLILVAEGRKHGYQNRAGKMVIPAQFDFASERFSEGMAWVQIKDRIGYIDNHGKTIVAPQFDYLGGFITGNFNGGLARVCLHSKCGYIDKTGKTVIPLQFNDAAVKFSNGLAWVKIGDRLEYIDKSGKVIIPARYIYPHRIKGVMEGKIGECGKNYCFDAHTNFDRGLAAVAIPEKCGFFDCKGYGYIDTTGKLVFKF
jgi:WG containing repeat